MDLKLAAAAAFEAGAAAAGGARETRFELGGRTVALRTAGSGVHEFFSRAFGQLPPGRGDPSIVLRVWDGASTGVRLPPPAWRDGDTIRNGFLPSLSDDRIGAWFDAERRDVLIVDTDAGEALRWVEDAALLPSYEHAAPLRFALGRLLRSAGWVVCHAAAVGRGGRGLLVAGPGGSGKSTTALAAMADGWTCAGDDWVGVRAEPPAVCSLYGSVKLHRQFAGALPGFEDLWANASMHDGEKYVAWPFERASAPPADTMRIGAIVLPRVVGAPRPRLSPARPADALKALAPTSLLRSEEPDPRDFFSLSALTRSVPAYHLELGGEPGSIPRALEALL